jgi:BirA family biotin operon repressor/biotin-[acetyl-CoA-carboxylase] ligase
MRRHEVALVVALELLSGAVALAVCEACEDVAKVACLIKWPNDVWVRERKLAGILIESRPQAGWAVIGIGLNVDTPPDELGSELRESATSLRIESEAPVDRDRALGALLDRLSARLEDLGRHTRNGLLAAYRKRDLLRGRQIRWTAGGASLHGEAQGIDERGRLVVFTDSGERLLLEAGEVHLNIESASSNT